jgi:alpha-glucosidase
MTNLKWWQSAVFYQIYPRSFADGNGDGIGDLPGIISRLDYLQELGVDALWLSPHFPSPQADCGYDISDYCSVAPEYGDMQQFKLLLDETHRRGMRLILDLVLNHTSDQHAWFQESRSSLTNPKRDWYIWKPGNGSLPPNNWNSTFGGPAWQFDAHTGEYYYHFFFREQPDLNWRNPDVKAAMFAVVRFWLDMGVDGFRLDAIGTIFEDPGLPNHKAKFSQVELYQMDDQAKTAEEKEHVKALWEEMFCHQHDRPEVHDLMRELRAVVDEYDDRVLVGETDDLAFYGNGKDELHLVFNFPLMRTDRLTAAHVRANQATLNAGMPIGAWGCNVLGNHDCTRLATQFADHGKNPDAMRAALVLLLTLPGSPFIYYGEEIGMTDMYLERPDQFRDPLGLVAYQLAVSLQGGNSPATTRIAAEYSRDRCRTPMQWQNAPNAGFSPSGVTTWLPVNPNFTMGINVADQDGDPNSLLNFYRRMLALRRQYPALISGELTFLATDDPDLLVYERRTSDQTCLIIINFGKVPRRLDYPIPGASRLVLSTHLSTLPASLDMPFVPQEARIYLIE